MHHFKFIERLFYERQTIKERINELHHWLLSSSKNELFTQSLSLKRSKLNQQIINFRQFHAQLHAHRCSFDCDINITINFEHLFDNSDKSSLKIIEQYFQLLEEQTNQFDKRINYLSTRLNKFHLEHAHLTDIYSHSIRLYTEQINQNTDLNFSTLELLLNSDQALTIDHTLYEQLKEELLETNNTDDKHEILRYSQLIDEFKNQYEIFHNDLKLILKNRAFILSQYEVIKYQIQEWLLLTEDRLLKQKLTIQLCQRLLNEHSELPVEQFKIITEQLIQFYSSPNLLNLYEQLKFSVPIKHSNLTSIFQSQANELIENYLAMKEKILHYMALLENIKQPTTEYQSIKQLVKYSIEKAKELVTLEQNIILPFDNQQIEIMLEKYQVNIYLKRKQSRNFTELNLFSNLELS